MPDHHLVTVGALVSDRPTPTAARRRQASHVLRTNGPEASATHRPGGCCATAH